MRYVIYSILIVFTVSCADTTPLHSQFHIGTSREEITSRFGAPTRIQTFTKQGQAIWGSIEDYWERVPQGSSVEIWAYRSKINLEGADESYVQTGETELYFVDSSYSVNAIGFHFDGAVYEGNNSGT